MENYKKRYYIFLMLTIISGIDFCSIYFIENLKNIKMSIGIISTGLAFIFGATFGVLFFTTISSLFIIWFFATLYYKNKLDFLKKNNGKI